MEKGSLKVDLGGMKAPWSSVCSQGVGNTEMMWQHSGAKCPQGISAGLACKKSLFDLKILSSRD